MSSHIQEVAPRKVRFSRAAVALFNARWPARPTPRRGVGRAMTGSPLRMAGHKGEE